ncbi:MAG: ABC transporter permease subunit [Bryobacterales bacterium]|nr:ABC transporter permease subunit [Bryobacterales bacterium]
MVAPAMLVILGLFASGVVSAILESLGRYQDPALTFRYYSQLFSDREIRASLGFSLGVAAIATGLSAAFGLMLALRLRRAAHAWTGWNTLLQFPLAVPHLAMAFVVLQLISSSGLAARIAYHAGIISMPAEFPSLVNDRFGAGIVLVYVLKETPFVALMILAVLTRLGDSYELAARTLGASAWQCFRHVTLPLAAPPLVASCLFVFAYILSAFEVPFVLGRPYPAMWSVIAQRRYMEADLAARPGAIALAVAASSLTALLVWLYLRAARSWSGLDKPAIF